MVRTRILAAALALGLTAALGACSGGTEQSDGPITLTLRQFDPPAETGGLQKALDTWNQSHPDVQVKMETLSGADAMQVRYPGTYSLGRYRSSHRRLHRWDEREACADGRSCRHW